MKRILSLLLAVLLGLSLFSCTGTPDLPTESEPATEPSTEPVETEPVETEPAETDPAETDPAETEPEIELMDQIYPWAEVPKTLRVLAVGNSFSVDAMEYLYQIAKDAGVETVILGNLRVSGCTIDMHIEFAETNSPSYTYLKNTTGTWVTTEGYTFEDGMQDEEWDFITLQQSSPLSGIFPSYEKFNKLVRIVNESKSNENAQLLWHMTWAYQKNSTHDGFASYNKNQMTMYGEIVAATQELVLKNKNIVNVIPTGTAVQNARTSWIGDNLTRDGYHMSIPVGRYLASLTFFAAITGADISGIDFSPSPQVTPEHIEVFKESVTNAMNQKFEVTQSTYTTKDADQ